MNALVEESRGHRLVIGGGGGGEIIYFQSQRFKAQFGAVGANYLLYKKLQSTGATAAA